MKKKTTISIITLQNIRNYGSALQALATQAIFEHLDCNVDFINFVRTDQKSFSNRIKTWCNGFGLIKKITYAVLLYPTFLRQDKVFNYFLKRYLNVQDKQYSTDAEFEHFPITSDIYCTGSDQTWNSEWNQGIIKAMFLNFVPDNVRKIAYAASFGKSQLNEWEKDETHKLLSRYTAISVRENSGVNIIDNLGLPKAIHVLDPTLQVDSSFWKKYIGKRIIKEPYVLIYQLNTNHDFDNYAKEFAKRKRIKLVRFCWRFDQCIKSGKPIIIPNVTDFISTIYYADTVLTDSFHATAFCLNMNTPMVCIYPNEFGGRLASILKLTELENRHLTSFNDFSFINSSIDFSKVNIILIRERKKGWEFLKQAIQ